MSDNARYRLSADEINPDRSGVAGSRQKRPWVGGGLRDVRHQFCSWKVLLVALWNIGVQVRSLRTLIGSYLGGDEAKLSLPQ